MASFPANYGPSAANGKDKFSGDVLTVHDATGVPRQYSWYEAACSRVMRQDAMRSDQLCRSGAISVDVQSSLLRYLHTSCSTLDNRSFSDLLQLGLSILALYPKLNPDDQIVWLSQDVHLRETCLPSLQTFLESSRHFANSPTFQTPQERQPYLDDVSALETLIDIFRQEIVYIREVQRRLLQHLPLDKASCLADRYNLPTPSMTANSDAGTTAPQTVPEASARAPLAPISANVKTESTAPASLKRKRGAPPASRNMAEVIDLCGSDDEEEKDLQGQADALQARIAAIRARTAHEDHLMPSKKPRSQPNNANSKTTSVQTASQSCRPSQEAKPLFTKASTLAEPTTEASAFSATMQSKASATTSSKDSRIRVHVQMSGRPALKLNISTDSHLQKLIRAAKKAWAIPDSQEAYLRLDGRRLNPSERVRRTSLRDLGYLDLHLIPVPGPQPPLKQTSIKPEAPTPKPRQEQGVEGFGSVQRREKPVVDLTTSCSPAPEAPAQPVPVSNAPSLCAEQQAVVDLILAGKNVFYTGSAGNFTPEGCGKSTVLKSFVPKLRELGYTVRIIAPTGKAALDINGSTTWTFAGWTPLHMKRPLEELKKAAHGKFVNKRLRGTDVLVIDEISMVENHIFQRLEVIMREARGDTRPFGGVQLIVTGDFCQLPPVKPFSFCITCGREQPQRMAADGQTVYRCPQHGDCNDNDKWAFRSAAWEACEFRHVNLTTIHRQNDEVFIKILQKLRAGSGLTPGDRQLLLDHPCDVNNAVKLFPTRDQVKRINQTEFDRLPSAKHSYTCLDFFKWNEELHPHLESKGKRSPFDGSLDALREHRLDNFVEFKKDMLVVLLVNLEQGSGLVNGSQGRIVDFEPYDPAKLPKARREMNGESAAASSSKSRFPKSSQSRSRSEEPPDTSPIANELRGEYAAMREGQIRWFINHPRNKSKLWPVVEFDNGIRRTIYADCQINELGDEAPYTLLARTQIPLVAAWAMTIHKSQGMTLNKVIVDLGKSFEEGQEYVALSRARSLEGLKVVSLGEGVGKGGNKEVKQFLWEKFGIR